MKTGFYLKLAIDGCRKNKRLYVPYLITSVMMTAVCYILSFLANLDTLSYVKGGSEARMILKLGDWVLLFFSAIFLFYSGSLLTKRRKKEFGLYNVLGMNKRRLSRVLLCENLITYLITMILGLGIGILLSKITELGLINAIGGTVDFSFRISLSDLLYTAAFFLVIFVLLYVFSGIQILSLKPVDMIKSENAGEKAPKANWLFGLLGVGLLAGAYYLAITIENPVEALTKFFIAVLMVIVGTYLIFIAGSVLLCKILQKNKKYYFQAKHYVSVSSMAFRMKRNGAGLASICILITMVLVMISSTSCLFFGIEDCLKDKYPKDIDCYVSFGDYNPDKDVYLDNVEKAIEAEAADMNASIDNLYTFRAYILDGMLDEKNSIMSEDDFRNYDVEHYGDLYSVMIMDVREGNRLFGTDYSLKEGEAVAVVEGKMISTGEITINGFTANVIETHKMSSTKGRNESALLSDNQSISNTLVLITPDIDRYEHTVMELDNPAALLYYIWYYQFDTDVDEDAQIELSSRAREVLLNTSLGNYTGKMSSYSDCYVAGEADFLGSFGGLFVLGILLSVVFLASAVMIIYYKQISEGYEDSSRFEIMQKVGMTKESIKESINSQMLMVFFMPIMFAVINMGFAFPFLRKLLLLFGLNNTSLLIITTVVSILICSVFYLIVYKATSNAYYSIVTETKDK